MGGGPPVIKLGDHLHHNLMVLLPECMCGVPEQTPGNKAMCKWRKEGKYLVIIIPYSRFFLEIKYFVNHQRTIRMILAHAQQYLQTAESPFSLGLHTCLFWPSFLQV